MDQSRLTLHSQHTIGIGGKHSNLLMADALPWLPRRPSSPISDTVPDSLGARVIEIAGRARARRARLIVSVRNGSAPRPHHIRRFDGHSLDMSLRPFGSPVQLSDHPLSCLLICVEQSQ